ncbi:MAG: type II secretion system protein GspN [Nitrospirae bacterium]|nr:type II secretion system protein GspN [Nitrospirota bacterium]
MRGNVVFKVLFTLTVIFVLTIALAFGAWMIAIPGSFIKGKIESSVKKPYKIEARDIKKGIFFNVTIGSIKVSKGSGELLTLTDTYVSFEPSSLLFRKLKLLLKTTLNGGVINGEVVAEKGEASGGGNFSDIDVGAFSYLRRLGIRGDGTLSGTFTLEGKGGQVVFSVTDFKFQDIYSHGIYVPLKYFNELKGAIRVENGVLEMKSVTATGKGIFARVKGKVENAFSDITIELMPEEDFPDKDKLAFLRQYEVSPGAYVITVKKRLF